MREEADMETVEINLLKAGIHHDIEHLTETLNRDWCVTNMKRLIEILKKQDGD